MLLAAEKKNKVVLLEAPDSDPGDEVNVEGVPNTEPFSELDINQFGRIKMVVDDDNKILVKNFGKHLKAPVEYIKANIDKGAKIR